jgi:hypothetical protein
VTTLSKPCRLLHASAGKCQAAVGSEVRCRMCCGRCCERLSCIQRRIESAVGRLPCGAWRVAAVTWHQRTKNDTVKKLACRKSFIVECESSVLSECTSAGQPHVVGIIYTVGKMLVFSPSSSTSTSTHPAKTEMSTESWT